MIAKRRSKLDVRRIRERAERFRDTVNIVWINKYSRLRIGYDFRNAADVAGDDRESCTPCFQKDVRHAFLF